MTFFQRHAYEIGAGAAALVWPLFRKRRRISIDNILRAGVAPDPAEAARIAKKAFCHFAGHIVEAVAVRGCITAENWRERVDCSEADPEAVALLMEKTDRPVLLVSAHHGCWEAATRVIPLKRPMIAVARTLDNPILRRFAERGRFRGSVTIVSKNNGMTPAVLEKWKRENAAMTLLVDQYAYGGALLRFFGRPARTVTSAARLAIRHGCPVVAGSFVRTGVCRYRLVGGRPLVFGRDTTREQAAQEMNDRLEDAIRRYPEQYLWMHRRWRDG